MNLPQYDVLIVGCGNIAGGFDVSRAAGLPPLTHAGAFAKHGGFKLTACVDPNKEQRAEFAKRWNVSHSVSEIAELCVGPGTYDVVSICSPTNMHREHIVQALELNPRVIFCEKPLTGEGDTASDIVDACQQQGVTLAVNYSRRWDPIVNELIHDVNAGVWGNVRSVVAHYNKGIVNNGSHMLELILRLLGPVEIVEIACANNDFWPSDATVAVLLTAVDGNVPIYLNPANARDYSFFELELVCEKGVVRMLSGGMTWQFRKAVRSSQFDGYQTVEEMQHIPGRYLETMSLAVNNLSDHLCNDSKVLCTGRDAIPVEALCRQITQMAVRKNTADR